MVALKTNEDDDEDSHDDLLQAHTMLEVSKAQRLLTW